MLPVRAGMILAAESIPSPLQLMLVTPESGIGKSDSPVHPVFSGKPGISRFPIPDSRFPIPDSRFDRHRSHAKTTSDAATISAFSFSPPATPTPFVSVPGIPVFIFGATEAGPAPLDPLPRYAHQQHFRQVVDAASSTRQQIIPPPSAAPAPTSVVAPQPSSPPPPPPATDQPPPPGPQLICGLSA
jgi:hypothetical protein